MAPLFPPHGPASWRYEQRVGVRVVERDVEGLARRRVAELQVADGSGAKGLRPGELSHLETVQPHRRLAGGAVGRGIELNRVPGTAGDRNGTGRGDAGDIVAQAQPAGGTYVYGRDRCLGRGAEAEQVHRTRAPVHDIEP